MDFDVFDYVYLYAEIQDEADDGKQHRLHQCEYHDRDLAAEQGGLLVQHRQTVHAVFFGVDHKLRFAVVFDLRELPGSVFIRVEEGHGVRKIVARGDIERLDHEIIIVVAFVLCQHKHDSRVAEAEGVG